MPVLTGRPLLVLVVAAALLAVAAVTWLSVGRRDGRTRRSVLVRGFAAVGLVLVAQGLAVVAFGLEVNDSYGFYASWNDLLGRTSTAGTMIHVGHLVVPGQGRAVVRTVPARRAGRLHQVLVWLPPQYDQPAYRGQRFPVVVFLPGDPSSPQVAFSHFQFGSFASREIAAGRVPPFIGVFPTLTVAPPRDTQCTNVPGGAQVETWLARDVPAYVRHHFRVAAPGRNWSVMGFSAGGFCAAKLLLAHEQQFSSATSIAGYFHPLQDGSTGPLFGGSSRLRRHNSPTWLYLHHGLPRDRLLVISSRQDIQAWPEARRFLSLARTDPHVASLLPPQGGHNYTVYRSLLPRALQWTASGWTPHTVGVVHTAA